MINFILDIRINTSNTDRLFPEKMKIQILDQVRIQIGIYICFLGLIGSSKKRLRPFPIL